MQSKSSLKVSLCILHIALCLLGLRSAHAADVQELFRQGNAAYQATKFNDAVAAYESARSQGLASWTLDYNLGNAYFKTGHIGKAIVEYERAFRRQSSDRDVIYNLAFASTKAGDPRMPSSGLLALFWKLFYGLTLNTLTILVSLLCLVVCVSVTGLLLGRWRAHADKVGVAAVLFGILGLWLGARISLAEQSSGVVIASSADVRSGPNLSYPANFTVPEGHGVLILDEQEPVSGWLEIGIPSQGLKGWVPDTAVEKI